MNVNFVARLAIFVVTALNFGFRLLVGAVFGVFAWGLDRWRRHRDWRVLGALLRVLTGAAVGWAIWWNYVRPIDPEDPVLLLIMLRIGCTVGGLWALVWLVFMQPTPPFPDERKHESEDEPPLPR